MFEHVSKAEHGFLHGCVGGGGGGQQASCLVAKWRRGATGFLFSS